MSLLVILSHSIHTPSWTKQGKYEEKLINSNSIASRPPKISFERLRKFNKGKWFAVLEYLDEWWINLTSRFKRHEKCNATLIVGTKGERKLVFFPRKFDFTSSYIGWRKFLITSSSCSVSSCKSLSLSLRLGDEDEFQWRAYVVASGYDKGLNIRC